MSVVYPQSTEDTDIPYFQAETLSDSSDEQIGVEEDEDEDLDFNPLLKGALSPEASSSLSSENEGLDALDINAAHKETDLLSNPPMDLGNVGEEEEIVVQESEESIQRSKKRKEKESDQSIQPELKEIGTSGVEDVDKEVTNCDNIVDLDEEDAICRRTRARYSLADFTLDELESFLQETDAEDGVQNIDDEHEYRKFLAAVLQGESEGPVQETGNVDDEDEENDKDFEIELEEALDSDRDEIVRREVQKEGGARRPETRRKRQRKAPTQKEKSLGQANRPLRPLLPLAPYPPPPPPPPPSPGLDCQKIMLGSAYQYPSYSTQSGVTNPFTPHQIGQLHCLIHEHAQLLVQVFSLSVLDHSRKEVAGTVQRLMTELVQTRDEALSRRKVPYPDFVFQPPYVHPSVNDCSVDPSIAPGLQKDAPDTTPALRNYNSSEGRDKEHDQGDQGVNAENSAWVPSLNGPVLSILDAAPLSLVTSYIGDVSKAAREYKQRHLASSSASPVEKEPLFPHSSPPSSAEASSESLTGAASQDPTTVTMSPSGHQQPKKSMAAMLIENTKDSVAVAPKKIVNLAQRFFPLFNSTLFPHKPPPAALVNRVLFTDAEDELLAMGLMEYNTDWKAIQQRFLPCKSKHQIFVRQKNRCSSKAPENPIKAVRRMKTSPLTTDEKARIHEGLRLLKLDWMSVWKFIVPYRDPSLLPRQWRIALGTQKSYKTDAAKREKRRLYETRRRKCKAATFANWQSSPDKEDYLVNNTAEGNRSGDDNQDEEDDAYVHEAFLSDWRPGNSRLDNSENPLSSVVPQVNNTQVQACDSIISNQSNPDSLAKLSKNQVNLLPRQVRRRNDTRLVKLAPELPPVNLPPSVRVISQSAFKSYHGVNPHSTEISGSGAEAEIAVPRAAHLPKSGTSNSGHCNAKNNTHTYHRPQVSTLQPDQIVSEDKGSESDLQMHPLLFGTPEDGNSRYCTVDAGPSASGTVNFLPGNQLQASFCHFSKPHEASSAGDRFYTSRSSNENPSSTHTIDFHPLLQRTDDLYNEPVTVSDRHVSVNVESFGGRFSRLQNLSSPSLTEPYDSGSQFFAPDLNVPYEKTNELDLEIHLSSTSRKEKIVSGKKVTEPNYDGPRIGLLNSGVMKENQKDPVNNPDCLLFPIVANASKQGHGLSDRALVPSSTISRFTEDVLVEPSLPEIVMEHEELSDSEEEIGEHVEFECEEMADSEGEESESEQRVDVQGGRNAMVVDEVARNKKQVVQAATKGRTRSRRLELMARGKDLPEISLQLSLDSSASQLKSKKKVVNGNDQAGNSNSSRPNRSCKRRMPILKAVTTQTNPVDVLPQLQLGSTINPTRNLRKRVYRNDSSLPSRNLEFVSSSNLVSCSLSDACGVNNTSKNVVVMDLLSSKDVAAKEITSFRS